MKTGSEKHMQHFSGKVHLKPHQAEAQEVSAAIPEWNGSYTVQAEDIYQLYFHGPAFQVLEGCSAAGIACLAS